jgi:TRAP-type C4-dicarboxylate transport system permease small subunit
MVFLIVFGVFVCYFSVTMRSDLADQKSKISNIGNFLAFIASVVIIILSMLITFIFRHKIWNLAQKWDVIEQKVRI